MKIDTQHLPDDAAELKKLVTKLIAETEKKVTELTVENKSLKQDIDYYKEQLNLTRQKTFAASSEKSDNKAQKPLFNEAEDLVSKQKDLKVPKKTKSKLKNKIPKREPIDPALDRDETVYDIKTQDKTCCGKTMQPMGEVSSEQIDIIPAKVIIKKHTRLKYVCDCCKTIKTSTMPKQPIPKSLASPRLLATLATNKYSDGLPLYRQESVLARHGIHLKRSTTASWMIKVSELLQPLFNLMQDDLLTRPVLQADETPIQVLKEPGRKATSKSWMWVLASGKYNIGPPIILFYYDISRSASVPMKLLDGWSGHLMIDGYKGYDFVIEKQDIKACACLDHVRRKFHDAIKAKAKDSEPSLSDEFLDLIGQLYAVEKELKDLNADSRLQARIEKSQPILDKIRQKLDCHLEHIRPKSLLGQAMQYLDKQWSRLLRVLESGSIPISNELCENAIRPFALGRKNWIFSASQSGANASSLIYSIIETAKANGHEPFHYLNHVLEHLPNCESAEDFDKLLPYNLKLNS